MKNINLKEIKKITGGITCNCEYKYTTAIIDIDEKCQPKTTTTNTTESIKLPSNYCCDQLEDEDYCWGICGYILANNPHLEPEVKK